MITMQAGSGLWWLVAALSTIGVGASLLFVRQSWRGGNLPGCGPQSDCQAVSTSRWAKVGPVPISFLGLGLYGCLLAAIVAGRCASLAPWAVMINGIAAAALVGGALWFTLLQLVVLRRVCKFCMLYHGIGTAAGILILIAQCDVALLNGVLGGCSTLVLAMLQVLLPTKEWARNNFPIYVTAGTAR